MKMAGYNVPQDGTWGPYQQQIWDKMNTREKEYKPTIWGLLQKGYDTITGDTTYKKQEPIVRATKGQPSRKVDKYKRNKDYWHPIWGAAERWKASISNDTNPLVGINRTIVPAVAGAAILEYAPAMISKAVTSVPHIAKAVMSHPQLSAQVAKKGLYNFGKTFIKGMLGGEAVQIGTKTLTNDDWGHFVSKYTGIDPEVADWLNPGYLLGGKNFGITDRFKAIGKAKQDHTQAVKVLEDATRNLREHEVQLQLAEDAHSMLKERYRHLRDIAFDKSRELRSIDETLSNVRPLKQGWGRDKGALRSKYNQAVMSDDIPREKAAVTYNIGEMEAATGVSTGPSKSTIRFENPNGGVGEAVITSPSKQTGVDISYTRAEMPVTPEGLEIKGFMGRSPKRFGTIMEGNTENLQSGIGKYIDDLHGIMGDDGVVAGSLVHYRNGVLKGTETPNGFIGPADTEIYTTVERLPSLQQKLKFQESRLNSTGGHKGTSPYTFRNNDPAHNGVDTEINIIEADDKGMATGKIAHQIYRALWPERYSKIVYDSTMSGKLSSPADLSLPITAEDLLQTLRRDPEAMQTHLLSDMVGMETFTNPTHTKATKRLYSVLFNPDNGTPQRLAKALRIHGKYNMGSQFKQGTELYPNLTFDNTEANKEFLMGMFGLTEEEATKFATNPEIMANAFNLFNFGMSTGTRLVGNDIVTKKVGDKLWHDPIMELFEGNGAFSGGQGSGAGINTTLLNPYAGWHYGKAVGGFDRNLMAITQRPLTYHPENIRTPMDLVNQVKRLTEADSQPFYSGELATFHSDKPIEYNLEEVERLRRLSESTDTPMLLRPGLYGFAYSGGLAKPIASGARFAREGDSPELGSLLKDMLEAEEGGSTKPYVLEDLPESLQQFAEGLRNRGEEFLNEFIKKWKTSGLSWRGSILKGNTAYKSNHATMPFDTEEFTYVPQEYILYKRNPHAYNVHKFSLNGNEYNPYVIQNDISGAQLNANFYDKNHMYDLNYNSKYVEDLKKQISEGNRKWTEYIKLYKQLRAGRYQKLIESRKADSAWGKAEKASNAQRDKVRILSTKTSEAKRAYNRAVSEEDWARGDIRRAKSDFKTHLQGLAITGGVGGFVFGLPYFIQKSNQKWDDYAVQEYRGDMDPDNGFYEMALYDEGIDEDTIKKLLAEAKVRYNQKHGKK